MTHPHAIPDSTDPFRSILVPLAAACLFSSCNLSRTIPSEELDASSSTGAHLVAAKGVVLRLGSDDPQAAPEERPGWTRFGHDFWMDRTEFTQKEFASLLGHNPSRTKGDDLPVTDVTWYDAVLAANARSKRDGLDTVYLYTSASRTEDGRVIDLRGLSVHLERSGWRLPTEAEWELAARAGTTTPYPWGFRSDSAKASEQAWFHANSDGRVHEVATLAPNAWGFHDMAGNVLEWTGDWKAPFPADTTLDFAGSVSPGDLGDIPVKGGAFRFGYSSLRPSSRSSTYTTSRASSADYVGFRLVRGGFEPNLVDNLGRISEFPPVDLAPFDPAAVVGTRSVRLAFLNRWNGKGVLSWIDFAESSPQVRTIPDSLASFHPAISPDGNWIAWCTALEGTIGPSRIRIRRLVAGPSPILDLGEGAIPRWWVRGTDTFLIRAEAMDNLLDSWKDTRTTLRRWKGGALESAETSIASGSFHDGRSGNFLYTGYRLLRQHDLKTGADRVLFVAPDNGKSAGDTSQVCNTSAAPDNTGRVLFLDFGSNSKSTVVGRPYGIHEIAFVADSGGRVLSHIPAPVGERQWEHLEWSNAPRWAAASVQDFSGANHQLRLVDLEFGDSPVLARGRDLWQPALWIDPQANGSSTFRFDSAGAWNEPETRSSREFADKAQIFWRNRDSIEYAFLGSSRVRVGLNSEFFKTGSAINLGLTACEILCSESILEQYVVPHAPGLKGVLMSMESGWWFWFRTQIWQEIDRTTGYQFDRNHGFWKEGAPDEYRQAVLSRKLPDAGHTTLGNLGVQLPGLGWKNPDCVPPSQEDMTSEPFLSNWQNLLQAIRLLESRKIHLVLVNFPQNPGYKDLPQCSGNWEPSWKTMAILQQRLRDLESKHPYFHFHDANRNGAHSFLFSDFTDPSHLSYAGSKKMTAEVDSIFSRFGASP